MAKFGGPKQPDQPPLVAGMMAIGPGRRGTLCSKWLDCLTGLIGLADHLVIRMDERLTTEQMESIEKLIKDCGESYILPPIEIPFGTEWRDEMLRKLDDVEPDIVLVPDCDEEFESGITQDINRLWRDEDACGLMFQFHTPGTDQVYPNEPHMKAFMWKAGLTYDRGTGMAYRIIPGTYACARTFPRLQAGSKIRHWVEPVPPPTKTSNRTKLNAPGDVTVSISTSGQSVADCLSSLNRAVRKF